MTQGAAFFDLDRTLLAGASGEVFSHAMREAGLVTRSIPGENLLYKLFNTIGETLPSMALARQAVTFAKGRQRSVVQHAASGAADALAALVQPLAAPLFAQHRAAGRQLVMATTTPYDLVKPLADLLGLDDVVATRYGLNADGTYDGTLDGPFVWSAGKLSAVRDWAVAHGVDLAESFAYSDSVYDTPLLAAVGHPFVVNPDPRMKLMAAARRWPTLDLSAAADLTKDVSSMAKIPVVNMEIQRLALSFTHPLFFPYAKFRISGTDNIPASGPAIIVGNHRSYFDSAALAVTIAQTDRTVRFLGKKEVFDAPVVGQLAAAMGGIRVDRGTGSDEPLQAAAEALANGDLVAMMPQGTIPRGKAFYDPQLKGRWGAARLAALAKVPVIPVGLWGTEKVWPRSARVPNMLNLVAPPTVTVTVGSPVKLGHRSPDADTKRIMKALMDLLPAESREQHEPTAEEIALALPPGYKGDLQHESRRRPGTD
ncbi:MAG: HAD-IB family hydrolase [Ilumatobacteraceae bacterium]|nr:HAD-IB family hydrolase [Acidimicrobiaceae bacterium]MBP6488463.1 HAD-IB family hydrolase [Ilumatobacteraceae bacterium]MBP7890645.1 HAD-IB family hydrolase [Ilumatobacteraceae bacterium]MBP8208475.1 HAD-IB family hydrolase [Ilumatobacteraceae bacterium]HRA84865.1 HAD-IB family hydrolase [Ilumatobacteraceae bacterium]